MINETKRNIEAYKALLPGLKERVAAVALMLVMSVVMMTSATYAWLTISRAPEVQGMNTTITGNGNLEIALATGSLADALLSPADSKAGDSSSTIGKTLLDANITWGNLINLSDSRYGLDQIALRPALLSGYGLLDAPLSGATYGEDGRLISTTDRYGYATYTEMPDKTWRFMAGSAVNYGVRAITSMKYENAVVNAIENAALLAARSAYSEARAEYTKIIQNETILSLPGYAEQRSMDVLATLIQTYVQNKGEEVMSNAGGGILGGFVNYQPADYSSIVAYAARLVEKFYEINTLEGTALVYLANLQAYKNGQPDTNTFADVDALLTAYKKREGNYKTDGAYLKAVYGVELASLGTYVTDRTNILKSLNGDGANVKGLRYWEEQCNETVAENQRPAVYWDDIGPSVALLVDINSTAIAAKKGGEYVTVGSINTSMIGTLQNIAAKCSGPETPADVVIKGGALANTDKRLPTFDGTLEKKGQTISIYLNVGALGMGIKGTVYAKVRTENADFQSGIDEGNTVDMPYAGDENGSQSGLPVAKDTYGLAVDLWVRTNVENVVLTLEGSLVTEDVPVTVINSQGQEATLYTLHMEETTEVEVIIVEGVCYTIEGHQELGKKSELEMLGHKFTTTNEKYTYSGTEYPVYMLSETHTNATDAYLMNDVWYYAESHEKIDTEENLKDTVSEVQTVEMVVGYDGVSRVWEDYLTLIKLGQMAENNTTQGAGSCYVFYSDPSEQLRILNLLKAFTIVFIDEEGTPLGTAKLDTEHYYSINGKTTVPLVMASGQEYTDEEGNVQVGITKLDQNVPKQITAVVYLNGESISNEDVLAVGEIQGNLNIQFGSSVNLNNQDDTGLRFETFEITASATDGTNTNSSSEDAPLNFQYDGGKAKQVTVNLTVKGSQPNTIKGFFIRYISATQGTRGETVTFEKVSTDGDVCIWTATFELFKPGTYSLRNVIVDGSDYELYDGTDNKDDKDNYPTVSITGLGLVGASCGLNAGVTMTADTYVEAPVTAIINADASLMPSNVRALFRSKDTNREYTAFLHYDGEAIGGAQWTGSATFTESDTYTLEYIVIDGEFYPIPEDEKTAHIIYLGLSARVYTTFETEFDYTKTETIPVQIKIFDRSGKKEVTGLEDVWLYYHSDGSVLDEFGMYNEVKWNEKTGYYEGTLTMSASGIYIFNRVIIDKNSANYSTITRATVAPTFTAKSTTPPTFDGASYQESYQVSLDGTATMNVTMSHAQTAVVWAEIAYVNKNRETTSGTSVMVLSTRKEQTLTPNQVVLYFDVPKLDVDGDNVNTQDGNWQIVALYVQGVAKPIGDEGEMEWISATDDIPTKPVDDTAGNLDKFYVFDLNGETNLSTKVVQTVYFNGVTQDKLTFDTGVFGATYTITDKGQIVVNKEDITATFMTTHSTGALTLEIRDFEGMAIQGVSDVKWTVEHLGDQLEKGSYKGGSYQPNDVHEAQFELTAANGKDYSAAALSLQLAGTYETELELEINGVAIKGLSGPTYLVYSKAPTVTISAITPTGSNPTKVTWSMKDANGCSSDAPIFTVTDSKKSEFTAYKATVYATATADNSTQHNGGFTQPTITLTIAGVDSSSAVSLVLGAGDANAVTFSRTGNGTVKATLGVVESIRTWTTTLIFTHTLRAYYGHGTQTITEMTITRNGVTYTVYLENPLTIVNPSSVNQTS